jgi:hypothetical protein
MKYWAFLSYSHQDNLETRADESRGHIRWAEWLHDGKRIVATSDDKASIWDILPTAGRTGVPSWTLQLADAIAGRHMNDVGFFEVNHEDIIETLNRIRHQLSSESPEDGWVIWGRWFLADRSKRTISPFSKVSVPEYIEDRIKENTVESLDEAEQLAIGNPQLLQRIQKAREALKQQSEPATQH